MPFLVLLLLLSSLRYEHGAHYVQGEEFTFTVGINDTPIGKVEDPSINADQLAIQFEPGFDSHDHVQEKVRVDAFLCTQLPDASRAKLQACIKDGLVTINGGPVKKTSHSVKIGDVIACQIPPPRRLDAAPEASFTKLNLRSF